MKYDYIQKVYFNKELTDRPLDDYDDRLGKFCVIEMTEMRYKRRICEILTHIMGLMGYSGEIPYEEYLNSLEINYCWINEHNKEIHIQHKYWNGGEMALFCDIMAVLAKYQDFEIEYLSAEKIRKFTIY
ncbi:hypothetical protein QUF58_08580 [Anaerolineales bacterium HSG24]|nr:hypothetical protein [Anaerolineales bacterium HSG24]